MPTTAALDAEYAAWPIWPSNAATEAVLMIAPRSPATGSVLAIRSADSRSTLNVPIRLTLTTRMNSSRLCGPWLPITGMSATVLAQFTTIRSEPNESARSSATASGIGVADISGGEVCSFS